MKTPILIAAIAPTFWTSFALSCVGKPVTPTTPGELLTGELVIFMAIITIPCAVIGYFCGKCSE